jgi:formylglycine-generating enzyme required for sulfatase activity
MARNHDDINNDFLAFDVAEQLLARIRNGEPFDLGKECADYPEIADRIRQIVEQAIATEGTLSESNLIETPPVTTSLSSRSFDSLMTRSAVSAPDGYEIIREVARGGMGVVYEAIQKRLNRTVAIKMVLDEDAKGVRRFLAEAEAIAAVRHANVVQVFESGQVNGRPYLAMEFCSGGSLADRFRQNDHSSVQQNVEIMLQVCLGVAEAHEVGIVHRDLKPANILFDSRGVPKTADFGLAKLTVDLDLTNTQFVLGTPAYMSPEQARGEAKFVGPPSDVWALGVILYEFLTRQRPFAGQTVVEILEQVKSATAPDVRRIRKDVPRDVSLIVAKCLSPEPHRRYSSASELAQDLQNWLAGRPVAAKPAALPERLIKWVRRNPLRAMFAGMMLAALVLFLVLMRHHDRRLVEVHVVGEIERLKAIPVSEAKFLAEALDDQRNVAEPLLRAFLQDVRAEKPIELQTELNAAVAMSVWTDEERNFLVRRSLELGPADLLVLRRFLVRENSSEKQLLQQLVAGESLTKPQLLRAIGMLANSSTVFEPDVIRDAAEQLLAEGQLGISLWLQALEPVMNQLAASLELLYLTNSGNDTGVLAAIALGNHGTLPVEQRIQLIRTGSRKQAFIMGNVLRNEPELTTVLITEWQNETLRRPKSQGWADAEEVALLNTEERVRIGLALISAGQTSIVVKDLGEGADPQLRTNLIGAFSEVGVPIPELLDLLAVELDQVARQTIYLALSQYAPGSWTTDSMSQLLRSASADFQNHPDPGVHSAIDLLLRRIDRPELSAEMQRTLPAEDARGVRRWFVNSKGISFAVIDGPIDVKMGSHQSDWGQDPGNELHATETFHHRHIGRSFAIAMKEITREQIAEFAGLNPEAAEGKTFNKMWSCRTDDSPAVDVSWYTAIKYCRWLGEQENLPADQQCYPPLSEIKEGITLPVDYLARTGYRLPTEAEWEFACRSGSSDHYSFGTDVESLPIHSWSVKNARHRTHPVASLRPNTLGLFDIHGNAFEWVDVRLTPYPSMDRMFPVVEDLADAGICQNGDTCVLRGGDFVSNEMRTRSAHRTQVQRTMSWPASGFRIARTISVAPLDVFVTDQSDRETQFAVRGRPGKFLISDVSENVELSQFHGAVPSDFTARPRPGTSGRYSFKVQSDANTEAVSVSGEFISPKWTLRWHQWDKNPDNLDGPSADAWDRMLAGPVLYEETRDSLRSNFGLEPPAPGVPASFCALVATAELSLVGGEYEFECVNDGGGYLIRMGNRVVLALACPGHVNRRVTKMVLPAGTYPVRVEAFHVVDNGLLDLRIAPAQTDRQTP